MARTKARSKNRSYTNDRQLRAQGLILTQRVSPRVPLQTNREIPHFAIDDVVKIRSNLDLLKTLQKNHGGFNEDMVEVLVSPCILEYQNVFGMHLT